MANREILFVQSEVGGIGVAGRPPAEKSAISNIVMCCIVLAVAAGCGDGRPGRVQVAGQVLIDGEPLTYGFIRFLPTGGRTASAKLNEEGRFVMSTFGKYDGVILGTHRIEIDGSEEISSKQRKWHAPKKYFNFRTSELTQEVTDDLDALIINLTWDGGEPFVERIR